MRDDVPRILLPIVCLVCGQWPCACETGVEVTEETTVEVEESTETPADSAFGMANGE